MFSVGRSQQIRRAYEPTIKSHSEHPVKATTVRPTMYQVKPVSHTTETASNPTTCRTALAALGAVQYHGAYIF